MALPPEQLSIKRRREEEPVETLYIQSEVHQTKRRFTDFVFQRVRTSSSDGRNGQPSSSSLSSFSTAQRALRSPRSASSLDFASASSTVPPSQAGLVPTVRATSPGAELRDEQRLATTRKEAHERLKRALPSAPTEPNVTGSAAVLAPAPSLSDDGAIPLAVKASSVRTFQISRPTTPVRWKTVSGGVQKRRSESVPSVAVLVERLRRKQPSRRASIVELALQPENVAANVADADVHPVVSGFRQPRKRPVVNEAEKLWREESRMAISAAKQHLSEVLDKEAQSHHSTWDEESERLAREFEQIALEIENETPQVSRRDVAPPPISTTTQAAFSNPALKYLPRSPNKARAAALTADSAVDVKTVVDQQAGSLDGRNFEAATELPQIRDQVGSCHAADDSDGEYVYDTYIRRPLPDGVSMADLAVYIDTHHGTWLQQTGIDISRSDVGLIVIPREDEEYWEQHYVEEDEVDDRWNSEDPDSNAEDNPANDYPEDEMSSGDENDDPTAIYSRYRRRAVSDDEEYGIDEYESDGAFSGAPSHRRTADSGDELSDSEIRDW